MLPAAGLPRLRALLYACVQRRRPSCSPDSSRRGNRCAAGPSPASGLLVAGFYFVTPTAAARRLIASTAAARRLIAPTAAARRLVAPTAARRLVARASAAHRHVAKTSIRPMLLRLSEARWKKRKTSQPVSADSHCLAAAQTSIRPMLLHLGCCSKLPLPFVLRCSLWLSCPIPIAAAYGRASSDQH